MNRILTFGFLLLLASCVQKKSNNNIKQIKDSLTSKIDDKSKPAQLTNETRKHETFNENIDTLPQALKTFIPAGYAAINMATGDANLDGFTDQDRCRAF